MTGESSAPEQLSSSTITRAEDTGTRPNVLVILVDDLGYSDLGCYGGEIETPTLNNLADAGAQFTNSYVQPRCSPTRASLLTGHTNQLLGFDVLAGDTELRQNHVFLPEVLQDNGYRTYLSGKWHLGSTDNFGESNVDRDPRVRGFDHAYRFTGYAAPPWDPDAYRLLSDAVEESSYQYTPDTTRYEEGETFYQTDAITDYALDFVQHHRRQNETAENRQPFFMYLAYGAPHFPLAAPKSLTQKYVSRYEEGWDTVREDRLRRMIDRGIVPSDVVLSPRSDVPERDSWETHQVRAWDSLSPERQDDLVQRMAVFAAMVEKIDTNVGRMLDDLAEHDQLSNTLVLFMSDNGACYEWHEFGHSVDDGPRIGNARTTMGTAVDEGLKYGAGWANVGSTPYRLYKHFGHEGGIRTPFIVRWDDSLNDDIRMGMNGDVTCSRDVMPTILDLLDIDLPDTWTAKNGGTYAVADFDETSESLRNLLLHGKSPGARKIGWEHEGNIAYRSGGWKLVGENFTDTDGVSAHEWELYDIGDDPTEQNDLADDHPERVTELARRWMNWAERNDVPIPEDVTTPS